MKIWIWLRVIPVLLLSPIAAAGAEPTVWLTGPALARQLAQPVTLRQAGQPLGTSLRNLAQAQRVAIFLDRRIDPGQERQIALRDVPLSIALENIAETYRLGTCELDSVTYFGPPESAAELRTMAALVEAQVRELPRDRRGVWMRPAAWRWDDLTTPRELLAQIERESSIRIVDALRVPHDLWPATDLAPLSLINRLTLLLAGFDLTFEISPDGRAARPVPIRRPVRLVRDYDAGASPGGVAAKLKELVPAEFQVAEGRLYVRGRLEDHELVQAALSGKPIRRPDPNHGNEQGGVKRYTLRVENKPLGPVLGALAEQIGLTLEFDKAAISQAGISLDSLVSFEVEQASLEELLKAVLTPAKLTFEQRGGALKIRPEQDQ